MLGRDPCARILFGCPLRGHNRAVRSRQLAGRSSVAGMFVRECAEADYKPVSGEPVRNPVEGVVEIDIFLLLAEVRIRRQVAVHRMETDVVAVHIGVVVVERSVVVAAGGERPWFGVLAIGRIVGCLLP